MNTPKSKPHKSIIKNVDKYICIKCNAIIRHKNNASHNRNMCKGFIHKVIYSCDSCSKQFLCKSKLEEHAKMHSRDSCNCDKCGKMYKRKGHLLKYASKCEGFQFTAENNDFQPTMDSILHN